MHSGLVLNLHSTFKPQKFKPFNILYQKSPYVKLTLCEIELEKHCLILMEMETEQVVMKITARKKYSTHLVSF